MGTAAAEGEIALAAVIQAQVKAALDRLLSRTERRLVWVEGRCPNRAPGRSGHAGWGEAMQLARQWALAGRRGVQVVDRRSATGVLVPVRGRVPR